MEHRYAIELLPSAVRELEKLPHEPSARVLEAIDSLQIEPRPPGARLLSGTGRERIWRVQVGQYRVLYEVVDERLVVLVVRVADRREVYNPAAMKRLLGRLWGGA